MSFMFLISGERLIAAGRGTPRDDASGLGLGERERLFLDENLSLSDPNRDLVGLVGDMVGKAEAACRRLVSGNRPVGGWRLELARRGLVYVCLFVLLVRLGGKRGKMQVRAQVADGAADGRGVLCLLRNTGMCSLYVDLGRHLLPSREGSECQCDNES